MLDQTPDNPAPARRWRRKTAVGSLTAVALLAATTAGVGAAVATGAVRIGSADTGALLRCDGGMSRLSHVFSADASVFPGDPAPSIEVLFEIDPDGFLLEQVTTGTHTGTHLDSPGHFIGGGVTVDELPADQLVWPAYVIDVRKRIAKKGPDDFQLTPADIRAVEKTQGRIPKGALVILQTGWDTKFGTDAYDAPTPGFSGETVQWLFDERHIGGLSADTFGPDATSDENYDATYTTLLNGGIVIPGLNNLDSLNPTGDIIMAGAVRLKDGSGYQVDPLACHGYGGGRQTDNDDGNDDDIGGHGGKNDDGGGKH